MEGELTELREKNSLCEQENKALQEAFTDIKNRIPE
jgi:hypothetical protein